jgi:PLP dependent protein
MQEAGSVATVVERLAEVRERIASACRSAGRGPERVRLVVITKTHPPDVAQAVVDAGVADLGESRVQELLEKARRVRGARWHHVGRLQRNKAADVAGGVALVHGVDRLALAEAISRHASAQEVVQQVLLQVNVGDDPRKGGCAPEEVADLVGRIRALAGVEIRGLMTMPPFPPPDADAAEHARPYFVRLRELRDDVSATWPEVTELSMGMTADLDAAVEEGSTIVRVGRGVLGPRRDPPWEPMIT